MKRWLLIGAGGLALVLAGVAGAQSPRQQALVDSTVHFLQESQDESGGFSQPGGKPSQSISAWVTLALAGAGINPQDQSRCGTDAYSFLVNHFQDGVKEELLAPEIATTAFERELLVVDAAGGDPHHFAGHDLVKEILDRRLGDGSYPYAPSGRSGEVNTTIFAILGLSPLHDPAIDHGIDESALWLIDQQNEDGGWYFSVGSPESETDMTGAALEALDAAGPPDSASELAGYKQARENALTYLRESQLPDGGFPALPRRESESNVASTAWAVQGIWATGGNPEDWTAGPLAKEPLDYMESMQQEDGHIRWRASRDLNGIWMTAYVTPAFSGQALPMPIAARFSPRASHGEAKDCLEAGKGGESPKPGDGVLAGGGGNGAPAFSRPKRQSKGKTPGGARVTHHRHGEQPRNHSGDRRGKNLRQAQGTESAEPEASASNQEVETVGGSVAGGAGTGGEGGDDGTGPGERGTALATDAQVQTAVGSSGEVIRGLVIGSPAGTEKGTLAFGAPGLKSAEAGSGEGLGAAVVIGLLVMLAALGGAGWERMRGALA